VGDFVRAGVSEIVLTHAWRFPHHTATFNQMPLFRVYYISMNRRLFFYPAAASVVWAQQQATPAEDEAKKALEARAQKYYQLMVEKKYRQAEVLVAEESKEDYYAGNKPDIKGFEILRSDIQPDGQKATVTIKAKVLVLMMGAGAKIFEMPTPTYWKLDNGEWSWYIPEEIKHATPFGKMKSDGKPGETGHPDEKGRAPEFGAMIGQITIDKTSVSLHAKELSQTVILENKLPGPVDLRIDPHVRAIKGLAVKADHLHLEAGQKATIEIRWDGKEVVADTVEIVAFPFNRVFEIRVTAK
jgi:hypothetical protein